MSSLIGGSMKRIHLLVLLSLLALPLAAAPASGSGSGSIVVGELYASGGNSGALYTKAKDDPGPVFRNDPLKRPYTPGRGKRRTRDHGC